MDSNKISKQQLLGVYKSQGISVERGFRFLKDPMFYTESLYLKLPKRIMALIMVMGLSLLVYSLAEKKLRGILANRELTVKDQKKRPTSRPTIRWFFKKAFCNVRYNIDYSYILSCKIFPLDIKVYFDYSITMELSKLAKAFKALSNEQRLKLFSLIYSWSKKEAEDKKEEGNCCKIQKAFTKACGHLNICRSTVSHHFKELQNAELISCSRSGQSQMCTVNTKTLKLLKDFLV